MVNKVYFLLVLTIVCAKGGQLQNDCLSCHQSQQIPNNLIYKRYLLKYSTENAIENAIFRYLKDPKKSASIMPAPFFLKFPMRKRLDMPEQVLRENIRSFIFEFDVKKNLKINGN